MLQDLKKFHYYYWFAFPSPSQPTICLRKNNIITTDFTPEHLMEISQAYKLLETEQKPFFVVRKENNKVTVVTLSKILDKNKASSQFDLDVSKIYFAFSDPSNNENPGWTLRIFLAALLEYCPIIKQKDISVIGIRYAKDGAIDKSRIFVVAVPEVSA